MIKPFKFYLKLLAKILILMINCMLIIDQPLSVHDLDTQFLGVLLDSNIIFKGQVISLKKKLNLIIMVLFIIRSLVDKK